MGEQAEQAEGTDLSQEKSPPGQTKQPGKPVGKVKVGTLGQPCQRHAAKRTRGLLEIGERTKGHPGGKTGGAGKQGTRRGGQRGRQ